MIPSKDLRRHPQRKVLRHGKQENNAEEKVPLLERIKIIILNFLRNSNPNKSVTRDILEKQSHRKFGPSRKSMVREALESLIKAGIVAVREAKHTCFYSYAPEGTLSSAA